MTRWLIASAIIVALLMISCSPSPENYAGATATLMKANSIQTSDALDVTWRETEQAHVNALNGATQTAVIAQVQATATALQVQAAATATAVPFNAVIAQTTADTQNVRTWVITGLTGGLAVASVLLALAIAATVYTRSKMLPRARDGQAQPVLIGGTVVDTQRAIGPAVTVRNPDIVDQFWHIVHGQPLPEPHVMALDAGADADHLLAAANSANAVSATSALMRPGLAPHDRSARVELTHKAGSRDPWTGQVNAPQTRVVVQGNDALQIIAQQLGDRMPKDFFPADQPAQALPEPELPIEYRIPVDENERATSGDEHAQP